ncbi:hypothetical protein N7523_003321 [Penicillium sp. IBT 18751x]|nr:hypothetical protein N7523_003321 [Penicillium sp. IBT 18751x]
MTAGVSPSSSPRLPSPPPFTEVQIGPQSPSVGESSGKDAELFLSAGEDDGSTRRIRPGTKTADMAFGPPLIPLSQLDSPFQLQEHLKALYNHFTKPEGSDTVIPINREVALQLAEPPEGVDRSLWLYELCRFLTMKVNNLIIAFFAENPPCSAQTCPEMRASEWQYLCAVHDPPKSCCAIDYCCHTLDWATNTLTSPKYFPSRLTLGSDAAGGPQASMRHLTNIFRRLYRIFAHAWFQHRDVFWEVEGHDGLYIFFKTVCDLFSLIPEDNYTIPLEAEGPDAVLPEDDEPVESKRLTILRKDNEAPFAGGAEGMDPSISTGATTRRHKHSPSTGSRVTTIAESAEDSEEPLQSAAPLREIMKDSPEHLLVPQSANDAENGQNTPVEAALPIAAEKATESTESTSGVQEEASEEVQQVADPQADEEVTKPEEAEPQGGDDISTGESTESAADEATEEPTGPTKASLEEVTEATTGSAEPIENASESKDAATDHDLTEPEPKPEEKADS